MASLLGFEPIDVSYGNTGLDGVFYNEKIGRYLIVEAKGGKSRLKRTQRPGGQFSHRWIKSRLDDLIDANRGSTAADRLREALRGDIMPAMVVSLNLRGKTGRLKVGIQLFDPDNRRAFEYPWSGF